MHALGHNSGHGEHTKPPVMYDWKQITNTINFVVNDYYNIISDFMSSRSDVPDVPTANRNEFYVDTMKRKFGEKDAVPDNKKVGYRDKNSTRDSLNKEMEKINSNSTTHKKRVEQKPWK
ncbi:MAG: hypothetical protein GC181_10975 [Bacteroidetes bacterium]|nr:hypothetical protein [Bacteroidota bacterium]